VWYTVISRNPIQIHVSLLQFALNGVSTAQISDSLPHRSQYSDYILEGQLSHNYQVDHRPEKEQITWLKKKHIIPLYYYTLCMHQCPRVKPSLHIYCTTCCTTTQMYFKLTSYSLGGIIYV
jgi:hypothetical protein